ncbi:RTA1-domain-containing protein [Aspergillus campestris IBT 28561]|uniref:RTA1-domain-containing protein n=1 Tax=Aspergillus campestris (strain IBT 28561) TaxID=1392248 RepID=A0A2I1CTT3_ASPC2|nr:RTA1-domain-containing protein [Aspergillus campestris IBT 28561]PKY01025.1 RTA1-domain-containing protein [Aspergillus campestris IBT 28561]
MSFATCTEVTPLCPVEATTYGYYPNYGGNIFFAAFFGFCGLAQLGINIYFQAWTLAIALVGGSVLEMAGYIGRVLMHDNPWHSGAFKLQIVTLILGPTFVAAAVYLTLKHIMLALGPQHARLRPQLFTWVFIGCDIGSLVLQAAGGGVAAGAGNTDQRLLKIGDDIIIAGIAFQVATMGVCGVLGVEFFLRVWRSKSEEGGYKVRWMGLVIAAEVFAYFTVLIRCIYRLPEMAGGWGNPLMQKENEFLVLDGMMIALAVGSLTLVHPGFFLATLRKGKKSMILIRFD